LFQKLFYSLVEESEDLATNTLLTGLLVVHNALGGGKDNVAELTGGKEAGDPSLNLAVAKVVAGRDDAALIKPTIKLDNNLTRTVVINVLEVANVTMSLHKAEELHNDLGGGSNEDLPLAALLSVVHGLEGIAQNANTHHFSNLKRKKKTLSRKEGILSTFFS